MVTLVEATTVISRPKVLVTDMVWRAKTGKLVLDWVEAKLLLQFADEYEVPQRLYALCQWRKKQGLLSEHWTFSLFFRDERIYALDMQPDKRHDNDKAGKGRPCFMQSIYGSHEHTFSAEGYGYAEQIDLPEKEPEIIWEMFLKRAGIGAGDFYHPDDNQPELDL